MNSLDKHFSQKLQELQNAELLRHIRNYDDSLVDFASNDYLGLLGDQRIKNASIDAINKYGVGAGASRLITGNSALYDDLEDVISNYYGKEGGCVFSSGYAANLGAISALVGRGDLIIADKLSHACIIDGAQLSGAKFMRFRHNDYEHLEKLLLDHRSDYNKCLVITESIFSMDGDRADIKLLNEIAHKYNAWSYVDYAHDIETEKYVNTEAQPDIVMGTFSKGFASLGGYVCASDIVINYLKSKSKTLIYSTALPPSVLASSIESVKIVKTEKYRSQKALNNAGYFCNKMGLDAPESQIVPVILGDENKVISIRSEVENNGIIISAIRPPTVPKDTSRLRVSFSYNHNESQIDDLIKILKNIL